MPDEVIPAAEDKTTVDTQPVSSAAQEQQKTETAATEQQPAAAEAAAEQKAAPAAEGKAAAAEQKPVAEEKAETKPDKDEHVAELEAKVYALSAGIKAECADDVLALAKAKVNAETTMEQAIDKVVEMYPIFRGSEPATITTPTTKNDTVSEPDDALVNAVMGIKTK